jgi:hypothetical protein
MNLGLFVKLTRDWTIDLSETGNILRIYDGNTTKYFSAFGPQIDAFGMHQLASLSASDADSISFTRLVSSGPGAPAQLMLVLVTPQEGDPMPIQVLELLEMGGGATYTVDAPVRGMEMELFAVLRHDQEEFKLLGLIGTKLKR